MKRQNLNKVEKMLLESRFPTLRILFEEEEEKKEEKSDSGDDDMSDLFGDSGDSGGDEKKEEKSDKGEEEGGDDGNLDDLFGGGDEGGDEGGEGEEEGGDEGKAEEDKEPSAAEKAQEKEEKEKAIETAAKQAQQAFSDVVSGGLDMSSGNNFNDLLFKTEGYSRRHRQFKRLQENISRFLFKNINLRSLSRKENLSLTNFKMNERKMLRVGRVLSEASVDDIINDKFWKDNASVDIIVNNAINLTKNFQELIDIPTLIMNSVAIKFGKQAAEETGENKEAANQYKLKLEEFLGKYAKELQQLPDYKNYDVSKFRFNAGTPDVPAVGAKEPGA